VCPSRARMSGCVAMHATVDACAKSVATPVLDLQGGVGRPVVCVAKKNGVISSTSTFGGHLHGYLSWLVGASTHQQQNVDVFRIAQHFAGACVSANGAQKFQVTCIFSFLLRGGGPWGSPE
jgi:hypothetical protein